MKPYQAKMVRAKILKQELLAETSRYWSNLQIRCSVENDRAVYRVDMEKFPAVSYEIACIFSDIIQNLVSTLDFLAYSEYCKNPQSRLLGKDVYFKIFDTEAEYQKSIEKYQKEISPRFFNIVDGVKPYKEKQEHLWKLKKVNNISKHRNIVFTPGELSGINLDTLFQKFSKEFFKETGMEDVEFPKFNQFLVPADGDFTKEEGLIFTDSPGSICNFNQEFMFRFKIEESSIFESRTYLDDFVERSISNVEEIINLFD